MDEQVLKGMARWPDVPAVRGWLALDRRGQWLLRGEKIANPVVTGYIGRNYTCEPEGAWYFQNGPQRVYVDLEYTPFVFRVMETAGFRDHTGRVASPRGAWLDDEGNVLLETPCGVGVVHDADLALVLQRIVHRTTGVAPDDADLESGIEALRTGLPAELALRCGDEWIELGAVRRDDVPRRFGYTQQPGG